LRTDLSLGTLDVAIWSRGTTDLNDLVHHSDRGVQYLAICHAARLADAGEVSCWVAIDPIGSLPSYDSHLLSIVGAYRKRGAHSRDHAGPFRAPVPRSVIPDFRDIFGVSGLGIRFFTSQLASTAWRQK
jgi:hypothetical protein